MEREKPPPQSIGLKEEVVVEKHAYTVNHKGVRWLQNNAPRLYKGTGMVTVAGGRLLPPAILSIRLLRKTNSTLPVQVIMQHHEYGQAGRDV